MKTVERIPLYRQLYWQIKNEIFSGEILPGERMPTVEEMHAAYEVSHSTVLKALELLEREGLINKRRGAGIFVNEQVDIAVLNRQFFEVARPNLAVASRDRRVMTLEEGWMDPPRRVRLLMEKEEGGFNARGQVYAGRCLVEHIKDPRRRVYLEFYAPAWIGERHPGASALEFVGGTEPVSDDPKLRVDHYVQTYRPWTCERHMAEVLRLPEGTPVFRRFTQNRNKDGRLLLYTESAVTTNALVRRFKVFDEE